MFYFFSLVKEVSRCGPEEGDTSVPGIYIPSLLLLHWPQHVASMWWDKMAARGPVRRKEEVAAAAGAAPLSKGSSQRSHTILTCKL